MRTILSCVLVIAMSVLSCSLCLAEDLPRNINEIKSLTPEQAAELVANGGGHLSLSGLTSIDKDVLKILKSNPKIQLPYQYRDFPK